MICEIENVVTDVMSATTPMEKKASITLLIFSSSPKPVCEKSKVGTESREAALDGATAAIITVLRTSPIGKGMMAAPVQQSSMKGISKTMATSEEDLVA